MTNLEIFDSLKKGDKLNITFGDAINKSNQKKLIVSSKNTVGKGKSWESEKVTFTNLENPTGVKFFAYKRKNGNVSFAIGDMSISNVKIELENKMAKGGGVMEKKYAIYELAFGQPYNFYNEEQDKFIWSEPTKATLFTKKEAENKRAELLKPRIEHYQSTGKNYRELHIGDLFEKGILKKYAEGGGVDSSFEYTIGGL